MSKYTNKHQETSDAKKGSGKGIVLWIAAAAVLLAACILLQLFAAGDGERTYPVYINEVLASNTSYPNEDGRCCDYIELYNSADYPVDLTGFQLGDIAGSGRYAFPSGTVIEAHSYLVVYCDKTAEDGSYAQFGISRSGGESFYLIASNNAIVDSMTTMATDLDQSMVLLDNGQWSVSDSVTPGRANNAAPQSGQDIYNSGVSPVRITEFSAAGNGYVSQHALLCDWVELHNTASSPADISGFTLSDNVGNDKYRFPEGTVIPAGGYLVVYCADGAALTGIAPFGLSQLGGEDVVLKNAQGMIVEIVSSGSMESGSMALGADGVWALTGEPSPGFDNTPDGYSAFLKTIGAEAGTIVISEVMAASQYVLPDSFGEFSDWVELYNTGTEAVNLAGWFLSDDPNLPLKWQFPSVDIQPGQRLILFLSGRDAVSGNEVHADFSLSSSGESLILSSYLGTPVDTVTFGESKTNCSFVFETGSSEPVLTNAPTPGYPNDENGYETFCSAAMPAGPLAIWEVMTSNDWYLPQALGVCYDWVEIRNISDQSVRLSDYSITDDMDIPGMYTLPDKTLAPGQSIVIILSGDTALSNGNYSHAGFSLDAREDQLFLYGSGVLLDYVYLKDIPLQHSYGRSEDTGGFFYLTPTPNTANGSGYRQISAAPVSDIVAGVYTSDAGFTVPLSSEGSIYYTLDGSVPDAGSMRYEGPIQIDETTVLRAVSVEAGKMTSSVYTATFIIQEPHSIPVVSLVTDPDNLWGPNGIYKNGDIEIKEEKRSANLSYTGPDGSFSINCELSLHGATTVKAFDKKSFTVRFQDNYDGPLNYDVFEDGEVTTFCSLIVRAAHESTFSTHMRDALMGYVASENCETVVSQKHKYVALYLNGEYWGLYAIRELHSEEHYASYMDVPADTVTRVRYTTDEPSSLSDLYKSLDNNSLRYAANYKYAESILDISSFVDWMILEAYVGNLDIYENMRYYYSTADGLWRCGLVDVDLGMFGKAAFTEIAESFHHGKLITALLQNEEYQDRIARRLAELLAGPLSDESMLANIEMLCDTIRDEIPLEGERWGYDTAIWERFVSEIVEYCDGRAEYMINDFCAQVGFTAAEKREYFGHLLN